MDNKYLILVNKDNKMEIEKEKKMIKMIKMMMIKMIKIH